MLSSHKRGSLVSCANQGTWNQRAWVINLRPPHCSHGPWARIAGNTWLLEIPVQVKGNTCCENISSAGGPLAMVLLLFHVCQPPCRSGFCTCVAPEGLWGACLQSFPEGSGDRRLSAIGPFCRACIMYSGVGGGPRLSPFW